MNLDIPKNDIECWERYPKQHWVYDLSRLLDAQNIKWSPYKTNLCTQPVVNMDLTHVNKLNDTLQGCIYIQPYTDISLKTEVFIIKGEIKLIRHVNSLTNTELDHVIGEIELRINAFITLYFQRFTGVITITTIKNDIYSISLKPLDTSCSNYPIEAEKLIRKIYKKHEDVINQEPAII